MLIVERDGPVAVITLNRPEAMNALSKALRAELWAELQRLEADPAIAVLVLTGAGERAFTAGLDLKELGSDPVALRAVAGQDPVANPAAAIRACKKPVVAAVNGVAITGGFELALACDVILCAATARFADTHARVGILPTWGLSQLLSRVIGPYRAKELSLTGNFLDAQTARDWGLVNRVVEPGELMVTALKLAHDMAGVDGETAQVYKALIDDGYGRSLADGLALETERSSAHNAAVTPQSIEARRNALQARGRSQ
jgi:enoyl-CoA hydratase